ncbi:hotdog fold domain-containing protein [Rhodococcus sp. CH91]|uniref:hotdog fold domain-containing protein n=1 Tax=Rhodococcus sp. CH91 TaxID=2910256 RepID=UPI001F4A93BA|nr:hotdog fold domain-containing protein [Rhodococcus sp. CH91]
MDLAITPTYRAWTRLPRNPVGSALFSVGMCLRVPYFATVLPRVVHLEPGRCEVRAPKWWGVHNHLGTFHAIAACNLAETAMGLLAEATVPTTHRWIPKAMTTRYLAKATSGLRAVAELDAIPDFAQVGDGLEVTVPVSLRDASGAEVVHAEITIWVTARAGTPT